MRGHITSIEMDQAIRPSLEDFRAYHAGDRTEQRRQAMKDFLESVRASGSIRGRELSELSTLMKLGKMTGATGEELRPVFQLIVAQYASGVGLTNTPHALAGENSTSSGEKPGAQGNPGKKKGDRSRKAA